MDMKKIIMLVGALVVAGVSAFAVRALLSGGAGAPAAVAAAVSVDAQQEMSGTRLLVAQATLPIGTIISEEHVAFQPWPEDMVQNAYYLEDEMPAPVEGEPPIPGAKVADVLGKVVRMSIGAGQPLSQKSLVGPGESGFLAAALNPGMRAVTVPIDNISGVAGFVFPGDRVDLLLTHNIGDDGETDAATRAQQLKVAETIARNVRVLAIDQRTNDQTETPQSGRSVTFEVPPKMVEKITVARMIGQLNLSLRSIKEQRLALEQAIANGTIEVGEDQTAAEDLAMEFAITQKPDDNGSTFTTGGEVSRFALDQDGRTRIRKRREAAANPTQVVRVRRGRMVQAVTVGAEDGNGAAAATEETNAATSGGLRNVSEGA